MRVMASIARNGEFVTALLSPVLLAVCFYLPMRSMMNQAPGMDYAAFLMPIITLQSVAFAASAAAIRVAMDRVNRINIRFRSLPMPLLLPASARLAANAALLIVSLACAVVVSVVIGWRPGAGISGTVGLLALAFGVGIGLVLLADGIGDTIRVSLSADPVEEVKVGFEILKSLGLRHRGVTIISCPSCARQGFDVIKTVSALEERLAHITTSLSLSIIGCVVNGPGEALMTDIGFTGGGAGSGMVYLAGKQSHKLGNEAMIDHIVDLVEKKAASIEAASVE